MTHHDVIVVGLGTVGAAACKEMARRGLTVLGLDAFSPPHDRGSHHGESRSIRRAYLEGTAYVPMALRSWELWRKLERDSGTELLATTGNLTLGPVGAPAVEGFFQSAQSYKIPFEALTAAQVRRRWPQLSPPDDFAAGLEVEAGILFAERCIAAMLAGAEAAGAALHFQEPVSGWAEAAAGVQVKTPQRLYEAGRLLLAAGARNKALAGPSGGILSPKRVPVHWVAPPAGSSYGLGDFPVNFWQVPKTGTAAKALYSEFYALPALGAGRVKTAAHNDLADADPDHSAPRASEEEEDGIRAFLKQYLPGLNNQPMRSQICFYTLTPDGHFLLGPLPGHPHIFVAALAGHGFKFAPVLAEILADMLEGNPPSMDLSLIHI